MIPLLDSMGIARPLSLEPGIYWLVVQVDLDLAQDQWGFTAIETSPGSGLGLGYESAWMQNFAGFSLDCVEEWGSRVSDCNIPGTMMPPHPDFGFILRGAPQVPNIIEVPTLSPIAMIGFVCALFGVAFSLLRKRKGSYPAR